MEETPAVPVEWDEDEVMRRAFAAYFRRGGSVAPFPAGTSRVVEHAGLDYAVLHNVNGVLAVYRIRKDGSLKGLRRWPKGLEESM